MPSIGNRWCIKLHHLNKNSQVQLHTPIKLCVEWEMNLFCELFLVIFGNMNVDGPILTAKLVPRVQTQVTLTSRNTNLPLGSVWLDQVGFHLMTVGAHCAGNCSSNIHLYQYPSLLSGASAPHSGLGFFSCSSVTIFSAVSLKYFSGSNLLNVWEE
jgi:hypothetical protein